jgi:hypothetical protein
MHPVLALPLFPLSTVCYTENQTDPKEKPVADFITPTA